MNKATVEQVLADYESLSQRYESLSDEEKKQVEVKISERGMLIRMVSKVEPKLPGSSTRLNRRKSSRFEKSELPLATSSKTSFKSQPVKKNEARANSYEVLLDEQLIEFTKGYLETHEDLWMLKALVGSQAVMELLKQTKRIDDAFVENLIEKCEGEFFIDRGKRYLFATTNQLFESKFGQLEAVSPLDTLKKYGLQKMEEANEKNYSKI